MGHTKKADRGFECLYYWDAGCPMEAGLLAIPDSVTSYFFFFAAVFFLASCFFAAAVFFAAGFFLAGAFFDAGGGASGARASACRIRRVMASCLVRPCALHSFLSRATAFGGNQMADCCQPACFMRSLWAFTRSLMVSSR